VPSNHQELLNRLVRQLGILQNDSKYTDQLGESLRSAVAAQVPVATGNMAQKLLRYRVRRQGGTTWIYLGDASQLGNPGRAPRGTIRAFLQDYPQYKLRGKKRRFQERQAWWMLSLPAKRKLQELRMAGQYGGGYQSIGSGKAAYFYPQEGSDPDWAASAEAAGIVSQHFVAKAIQTWTETDLPRIVRQFNSDVASA